MFLSECDEGLKCFQRDGAAPVPGCAGDGVDNYDYCYSVTVAPTSDVNLSPSSTQAPTNASYDTTSPSSSISNTTATPSSSTTSDLTTDNGSLINGTLSPSQAPSQVVTLPFGVSLAPTSDDNGALGPTLHQDNITLSPSSSQAPNNTSLAPSPTSSMLNTTTNPSSSSSDLTVDETPSPQLPVVFESIQTFIGDYAGAYAGSSVSMTSSGEFIAVGFRGGISPIGDRVGMVGIYRRDDDGTYSQYGVDGMFGNSSNAEFGSSVSISDDGQRVAVGARSSSTPGNSKCGAVQVFEYSESTESFIQIGRTLYGPAERDRFGWDVSMDADGLRVAASSPRGNGGTGFAQVYEYDGSDWVEYGDAVTGAFASRFGFALSLSQDGGTLAVGAFTATDDEDVPNKGSVSIYTIEDSSLSPVQVLYGSGENVQFGYSVGLSGNGQRLVVGAKGYGIEGVGSMGMCGVFGQVYGSWASSRVVLGAEAGQELGLHAAISPDGSTVLCHGKGVLSVSGEDWLAEDIVSSLGDESFGTFKAISYSALSNEGQLLVGTSAYDTFKGTFEIFNLIGDDDTTSPELSFKFTTDSSGYEIGFNDTNVDLNLGTVLINNSTDESTPTPEELVEGDVTILGEDAGEDETLEGYLISTMLVDSNETNTGSGDVGFGEDENFTQGFGADLGTAGNGADSLINGTLTPSQAPSQVVTLPFGVSLAPTSDDNGALGPTLHQDNITLSPSSSQAPNNTSLAPSPTSSMLNTTTNPSSSSSDLTVDETPSPQLPVVFESIQTFIGDYAGAYAGSSVSMTSSGEFIAVGFRGGISPIGDRVGMVGIYRRDDDGTYSQYGVDGMFGNSSNAEFGSSVSISDDGQRVAVGARSSSTPGNSKCGAVQVFEYSESTESFIQIGRTLYGPAERDRFGWDVSMDADGLRVAASSPRGNGGTGFAQVYEYDGSDWVEYGDAVTGAFASRFGFALSLSQDGGTLAVGAFTATDDEDVPNKGSVSIYTIEDSSLSPVQVLYGSGENVQFGYSVGLSGNGQRLVVGAKGYGIEGVGSMGMCGVFGQVYGSWASSRVVLGAEAGQELGLHAAISPDGSTVLCHGKGVLSVSGEDWLAEDIVSSLGDESFGTFKAISYSALSNEGQLVVGTSAYDTFKGTFEIFNRV